MSGQCVAGYLRGRRENRIVWSLSMFYDFEAGSDRTLLGVFSTKARAVAAGFADAKGRDHRGVDVTVDDAVSWELESGRFVWQVERVVLNETRPL